MPSACITGLTGGPKRKNDPVGLTGSFVKPGSRPYSFAGFLAAAAGATASMTSKP